ncbi:MAG TPA: cytochrome P450 [Acidimicrobiales bacterium]|nr:cytochrome P450 [Acidimicrobiales bacterium]
MSGTEVAYNPFAEGFAENPYPQYTALRAADPIHHSPFGIWVLFRHDDVRTMLRDQSLSADERNMHQTVFSQVAQQEMGDAGDMGSHSMLNLDPPTHTRLRRLVSKAFTPRMIEQLRPRVEDLVDGILDRAAAAGGLELMDELAFPLPFAVITDLLGMPDTDTAELRRLSGMVVRSLEPVLDPTMLREIASAAVALNELIGAAIEWKRTRMTDDLLSALIAAEDEGDVLSEPELAEQVALLYIAGHETTVNLIGNGVLALLRHPDQMADLRSDPSLDGPAVEELLRYDSPVQMSRRITRAETTLGGETIEAGAFVVLGLASANRDPLRWGTTADQVDLRRPGAGDHVSFGGGHHYCLGAALARLEGQVAIGRLVRRFARMEMAGEPLYNGRRNLRGLAHLPLSVG